VPLLSNDGSTISGQLLAETFSELREKFGAASWETQTLQGLWEHEGIIYRDNLTRFFVDVSDLPEHRDFFKAFKEKLKHRFNQLDVWIISHPVDVI
jgi:predicted nucleic acid-binding protein